MSLYLCHPQPVNGYEERMEALSNRVAQRMGIDTDRWVIYLLERAEDGGLYGARVFEDPGDGGRIILDAGVLSPSSIGASEPAQLGLRSRIQVILNHEITEA